MDSDKIHKSIKNLRYIPIYSFLLMFFHVGMLLFGFDTSIAEIVVTIFGFYITYRFSVAFDFCTLHRLMIYYTYLIFVLIWCRRFPDGEYGLFGDYIFEARLAAFSIGLLLFMLLLIRHIRIHTTKRG